MSLFKKKKQEVINQDEDYYYLALTNYTDGNYQDTINNLISATNIDSTGRAELDLAMLSINTTVVTHDELDLDMFFEYCVEAMKKGNDKAYGLVTFVLDMCDNHEDLLHFIEDHKDYINDALFNIYVAEAYMDMFNSGDEDKYFDPSICHTACKIAIESASYEYDKFKNEFDDAVEFSIYSETYPNLDYSNLLGKAYWVSARAMLFYPEGYCDKDFIDTIEKALEYATFNDDIFLIYQLFLYAIFNNHFELGDSELCNKVMNKFDDFYHSLTSEQQASYSDAYNNMRDKYNEFFDKLGIN